MGGGSPGPGTYSSSSPSKTNTHHFVSLGYEEPTSGKLQGAGQVESVRVLETAQKDPKPPIIGPSTAPHSAYSNYVFKAFPGSSLLRRNSHQPRQGQASKSPRPAPKRSQEILRELSGYLDNCLDALVPKLRGELKPSNAHSSEATRPTTRPPPPLRPDLLNRTFASHLVSKVLEPALGLQPISPVRPVTMGGASKYVPKRRHPFRTSSPSEDTSEHPRDSRSAERLRVSATRS